MLAKAKAVSGVTGVFVATSARPETPVQLVPSGNRIVTEAPGIAFFARSRSSVDWSRDSSAVRGLAGGGLEAPGETAGEGAVDDPTAGERLAVGRDDGLPAGPTLAAAAPVAVADGGMSPEAAATSPGGSEATG
jgi:hypothetical protein